MKQQLTYYPIEWKRHGSAAVGEWLAFITCMAAHDCR